MMVATEDRVLTLKDVDVINTYCHIPGYTPFKVIQQQYQRIIDEEKNKTTELLLVEGEKNKFKLVTVISTDAETDERIYSNDTLYYTADGYKVENTVTGDTITFTRGA